MNLYTCFNVIKNKRVFRRPIFYLIVFIVIFSASARFLHRNLPPKSVGGSQVIKTIPFEIKLEAMDFALISCIWEPENESILRFGTDGYISDSKISEIGTKFKKNDVILSLKSDEEEAKLEALKSLQKVADRDHHSAKNLATTGHVSEFDKIRIKAKKQEIAAQIASLENYLARKKIIANYDGTVGEINHVAGDYVSPGFVIGKFYDNNSIAKCWAPRLIGHKIQKNQHAILTFGDGSSDATVESATTIDNNNLYKILIKPNDLQLIPEFKSRLIAKIFDSNLGAKIPISYIIQCKNGPNVLLLDVLGEKNLRPIKLVSPTQDGVWITGVQDGDLIVKP